MKERLHYIDIMKGLTMLVVVLHHVLWITVDLENVINPTVAWLHEWQDMLASFIMPAFFFITGYCSNFDKEFKPFFINNFKSLIVPSFTIGVALQLVYGRFDLLAYFNMAFHKGFLSFWFLYALFYGKIFFWLLHKFIKNKRNILLLLVICAFMSAICNDYNFLGWNFAQYRQVGNLCLYMGIGFYFKTYNKQQYLWILSLLFVVGVFASRLFEFTIPSVTATFLSTLSTEPIHILFALTGTFAMLYISRLISQNKCLEDIGKKTLIIYLIHNPIITKITELIFRDILNSTNNILISISTIFLMIIIATGVSHLICIILDTKYLRWTLGKF